MNGRYLTMIGDFFGSIEGGHLLFLAILFAFVYLLMKVIISISLKDRPISEENIKKINEEKTRYSDKEDKAVSDTFTFPYPMWMSSSIGSSEVSASEKQIKPPVLLNKPSASLKAVLKKAFYHSQVFEIQKEGVTTPNYLEFKTSWFENKIFWNGKRVKRIINLFGYKIKINHELKIDDIDYDVQVVAIFSIWTSFIQKIHLEFTQK